MKLQNNAEDAVSDRVYFVILWIFTTALVAGSTAGLNGLVHGAGGPGSLWTGTLFGMAVFCIGMIGWLVWVTGNRKEAKKTQTIVDGMKGRYANPAVHVDERGEYNPYEDDIIARR